MIDPSQITDEFLSDLRAKQEECAKKFPGYPEYVSEEALKQVERRVEQHAKFVQDALTAWFGYAAVRNLPMEKVRYWLRELAQQVAHEVAGHQAIAQAKQATRSSQNMLAAVFAGIELGSKKSSESDELETPGLW